MEKKKTNEVFIETHHNFHPYECGGIAEKCLHCIAIKNNNSEHTEKCALCEDGYYWDISPKQILYRRSVKEVKLSTN